MNTFTDLSICEKSILMVLTICCNPNTMRCDPQIKVLQNYVCASESTIKRAIKELEKKSLISRSFSSNNHTSYRLLFLNSSQYDSIQDDSSQNADRGSQIEPSQDDSSQNADRGSQIEPSTPFKMNPGGINLNPPYKGNESEGIKENIEKKSFSPTPSGEGLGVSQAQVNDSDVGVNGGTQGATANTTATNEPVEPAKPGILWQAWGPGATSSQAQDTPVENTHPNQPQPDAQPPVPEPTQPDATADTTPKAKPHKTTKKSEPKESYGEYGNVKMTKDEYHKLLEKFGDELAHSYIDQLDLALGTKNYGYKSHYMAILKWERSGYFNTRSSARPQQYRKATGFDLDEAREVSNRVLQRLIAESKS